MAGASMPSNKYIDLTLGASGATYKAPANGWVSFGKITNGNSQYIWINNDTTSVGYQLRATDGGGILLKGAIPVRKNDTFSAYYTAGGELHMFRFIYAVGSESEAS
jgi:hypothetical protein